MNKRQIQTFLQNQLYNRVKAIEKEYDDKISKLIDDKLSEINKLHGKNFTETIFSQVREVSQGIQELFQSIPVTYVSEIDTEGNPVFMTGRLGDREKTVKGEVKEFEYYLQSSVLKALREALFRGYTINPAYGSISEELRNRIKFFNSLEFGYYKNQMKKEISEVKAEYKKLMTVVSFMGGREATQYLTNLGFDCNMSKNLKDSPIKPESLDSKVLLGVGSENND